MQRTLFALSLAVASQFASALEIHAPSGTYVNDPGHTRLLWKINHMGLSNYTARMNDVAITLNFNAKDITKSTVTATINPMSVDTGFPGEKDFNKEIYSEEQILNASRYPEITFQSRSVKMTGENTMEVTGELELLGVTKPATLNVELMGSLESHPFVNVPALGFQASGTIDRTEFGQTFLSGVALGDTVEIEIQAEFLKQD